MIWLLLHKVGDDDVSEELNNVSSIFFLATMNGLSFKGQDKFHNVISNTFSIIPKMLFSHYLTQ